MIATTNLARDLPERLRTYAQAFLDAGAAHQVPPDLLAAICDRESGGGLYLRPKGPHGTGDWWARSGHWLGTPGTRTVSELPPGWSAASRSSAPWCIPDDGEGWGRGLMQLDFAGPLAHLKDFDWRDPSKNIRLGAEILAEALKHFPDNLRAGIAAYNCGRAAVQRALDDGHDVDRYTTQHDYSADVLRRREGFGWGGIDRGPRLDDHGDPA